MDSRRRALIVANDDYEHEGLQQLLSPAADAAALAGVLGDRQISDFDVQVVYNETAHIIQGRIEDLFLESRTDDVLLLHFSCHGLKSESGELFFAARNTRPNRLGSTAISADFVQRGMRISRSRSIVLLLDCCYGGAFSQGVAVRSSGDVNVLDSFPGGGLGGRGRAVITASSSMEYAFEGDQLAAEHDPRPSVFTAALVEGLATGDADLDEDGWISLSELYEYLFDRVRERNPHQTPSRDIEMQGELYLARSKRQRIRPLPIPADLQAATTDPNMFTRLGAVNELRVRLASDNLPVAASAHDILTQMARTDIQHVAQAATAALREAAVRVVEGALHFGPVTKGARPEHRTIRLLGPPLARACTFEASHPWIRLNETAEGVDVSINTEETGTLRGQITVKGPTGEAVVSVDVEITAGARRKLPTKAAGAAHQGDAPAPDEVITLQSQGTSKSPNSDSLEHGPQRQLSRDLITLTAGMLAVLTAILLLVELIFYYDSFIGGYVISMTVLTFAAGGCMLLPWTRQSVGPGILLGAVAASTWGLVLLAVQFTWYSDYFDYFGVGSWLEFVGHLILVLAALLTRLVLIRDPTIHFVPRWPGDARARAVIILGGASAVTLFFHFVALYNSYFSFFGLAFLVVAVMAFVMPACAVIAAPLRFGISLLAGWIGGGLAIFLNGYVYVSGSFDVTRAPAVIFGCTLLLLAVAAGCLSRTKVPG